MGQVDLVWLSAPHLALSKVVAAPLAVSKVVTRPRQYEWSHPGQVVLQLLVAVSESASWFELE